jgi:cation diffusion facilitator family transporter
VAASDPDFSAVHDPRGMQRTAIVSIVAACVLVALKLGTGLATGSLGLISAGIESSGDVIAAVLTFFALRLGATPADREHPFGHRRAENLASLGEAAILTAGGVVVTVEAIGRLTGGAETFTAHWYVFAVIGIAIAIDISRIAVSVRTAKRYRSAALRSNAFHFAGDLAGSIAVLVGLVLVASGVEQGDAIAALVVAGVIFAAAGRLVVENGRVLMDRSPADAHDAAEAAILALGPGIDLLRLRVRESAGRYFADAVVAVPPGQAVVEGHATADAVEGAVRDALPGSDVVVHVEPRRRNLTVRDRVLSAALSEPLVQEACDIALFEHAGGTTVALHIKLSDDLSLGEAHAAAERVEQAIVRQPGIVSAMTHIEPLERPIAAERDDPRHPETRERLAADVVARLGRPPLELDLVETEAGLVVLVAVAIGDRTLTEAHELARELEHQLRADRPYIAELIVHTEP